MFFTFREHVEDAGLVITIRTYYYKGVSSRGREGSMASSELKIERADFSSQSVA